MFVPGQDFFASIRAGAQKGEAPQDPDVITLEQFLHFCLEDPPIIRFITMIEKLDVSHECTDRCRRLAPRSARGADR